MIADNKRSQDNGFTVKDNNDLLLRIINTQSSCNYAYNLEHEYVQEMEIIFNNKNIPLTYVENLRKTIKRYLDIYNDYIMILKLCITLLEFKEKKSNNILTYENYFAKITYFNWEKRSVQILSQIYEFIKEKMKDKIIEDERIEKYNEYNNTKLPNKIKSKILQKYSSSLDYVVYKYLLDIKGDWIYRGNLIIPCGVDPCLNKLFNEWVKLFDYKINLYPIFNFFKTLAEKRILFDTVYYLLNEQYKFYERLVRSNRYQVYGLVNEIVLNLNLDVEMETNGSIEIAEYNFDRLFHDKSTIKMFERFHSSINKHNAQQFLIENSTERIVMSDIFNIIMVDAGYTRSTIDQYMCVFVINGLKYIYKNSWEDYVKKVLEERKAE